MANKVHLKKLAEGVLAWNEWRAENPNINVDLSGVYLVHEVARRNQLKAWRSLAPFISLLVTLLLQQTKITDYIVIFFEKIAFLNINYFPFTELILYTIIRLFIFFLVMLTLFSGLEFLLNYSRGKLNLRNINMKEVNLCGSDLEGVDLRNADLRNADLINSNLSYLEAIGVNFTDADLTGACIANWNINHTTVLENVKCDYIYIHINEDTGKFEQRRPLNSNNIFTTGEFTQRFKVFEKALETIDLTFTDGIDWKAFFQSFQEVRENYSQYKLAIQKIEDKDSALIIGLKFNVETDINIDEIKRMIEVQLKERYENKLKLLEFQYRTEINAKDHEIALYRQQNADLSEIAKNLASKNINVILQATGSGSIHNLEGVMSENYNNEFQRVNIANFANKVADNARQQANQHIQISEQKQILAEAAAVIQRLLKQLEQNNPMATEAEIINYVNDETTPSFKRRVIGALQGFSEAAIEEFLDNSYINIAKAIIKGWIKPD
ncbi:pentapeptide repeat-containing protein [Calothrix brevissima NIES-22]|nr:pentapeptide repeat-containing protein [Calothrix brevissima NIES-22]